MAVAAAADMVALAVAGMVALAAAAEVAEEAVAAAGEVVAAAAGAGGAAAGEAAEAATGAGAGAGATACPGEAVIPGARPEEFPSSLANAGAGFDGAGPASGAGFAALPINCGEGRAKVRVLT